MKYFVRASADAPVKGPFDRDALKKSLDRGLMKLEAEAREEDSEEWVTLKSLFKPETDSKERRAEYREYERAVELRNMERAHERSGASGQMGLGVAMVIAGIALTLISTSQAGGGGVIFVGLIVFGIVRIIRGAAAS